VAPPIDSLEEAIAAVGEADSSFLDFQPLDPNNIGASAWVGGVRQPRLRQIPRPAGPTCETISSD
jgi:hypothetical protein